MSNGANGHASGAYRGDAPGQGLWLVVIEAGIAFLVQTIEHVTEADVEEAWATNGVVKFTARITIALAAVIGAKPDENRTPEVFTLPIVQRLAHRIGFQDDITWLWAAHVIALISKMTPVNKARIAATIEQIEKAELEARAKRAGISLPSMAR